MVEHDPASAPLLRRAATYAVLNNRPETRQRWGVSPELVAQIRRLLVSGDTATAEKIVPDAVADDLSATSDVARAAAQARGIGATSVALPITDVSTAGDRVSWAQQVLAVAVATPDGAACG